jgi:hypothetical protein
MYTYIRIYIYIYPRSLGLIVTRKRRVVWNRGPNWLRERDPFSRKCKGSRHFLEGIGRVP